MSEAEALRSRAEDLAAPFPPLLAAAEHLAATVILGEHGRRRAGLGDEFWQYRPALPGDEARMIDWRRSGRSDVHYVREKEWQAAQSVSLWVDTAQSMNFRSAKAPRSKSEAAALLALAAAVLLVRGGERVGHTNSGLPPRAGNQQLARLSALLGAPDEADFGAPEIRGLPHHGRTLFISDFLGDISAVEAAVTSASDRDISGALVQVLDPEEEAFPFDGRTIFESMGGSLSHETLRARDLRDRYLDRLAARKAALGDLARATGWQMATFHTDKPMSSALLWIFAALERTH
ncbi:MAG: DUF58 domain-containing protein [Pseudomonadota bacterium]